MHSDDYPTAPLRAIRVVRRGSAVAAGTFAAVVSLMAGAAAAFMVDAATAPPAGAVTSTATIANKVIRTKHAPGATVHVVQTAPPVTHWRTRPRRTVTRTATRPAEVRTVTATVTVTATPAVTP